MTVMFKQERGLVTNKDEEMVQEWKWPWDGKLDQPAIGQVNEYITVRIAACFVISFFYKYQHAGEECARLPLYALNILVLATALDRDTFEYHIILTTAKLRPYLSVRNELLLQKENLLYVTALCDQLLCPLGDTSSLSDMA